MGNRHVKKTIILLGLLWLTCWLALHGAVNSSRLKKFPVVVCCSDSMMPWVCIDGSKFPSTKAEGLPLSIAFVTYATGPYNVFVASLWESIQKFAFIGHDVHLFVFTDQGNNSSFLPHPKVHKRQQERVGWPYDSLGRHFLYLQNIDWLSSMNYVIAIDSDSVIISHLDTSMLGERMACLQAWSYGNARDGFTYDRRLSYDGTPFSAAQIAADEGTCYFCGGIFGGSLAGFTEIIRETVALATKDINQVPSRIALWHDESYLNRVFIDSPPTVVLAPAFMYPEPPADSWLYSVEAPYSIRSAYFSGSTRRFSPRILNLGVRKHKEKTLEYYQPMVLDEVPLFMTSTHSTRKILQPGTVVFQNLVTITVKAFERPNCLRRLLISVAKTFPGISVIVLDDSDASTIDFDVSEFNTLNFTYVRSEYDVGLSEGRNRMLDLVATPYLLLLDDDFVLGDKVGLEELLTTLMMDVFDIAGGCVDSPQGSAWSYNFHESGGTLTQTPYVSCDSALSAISQPDFSSEKATCWRVDSILNFFLARTDFLSSIKWDPLLKVGEHEDFFLRVKDQNGRVGMCRGASAFNDNTCDSTHLYKAKRKRVFDFWVDFFLKRDIRKMVTPAGEYSLWCTEAHSKEFCSIQVRQENIWFDK